MGDSSPMLAHFRPLMEANACLICRWGACCWDPDNSSPN